MDNAERTPARSIEHTRPGQTLCVRIIMRRPVRHLPLLRRRPARTIRGRLCRRLPKDDAIGDPINPQRASVCRRLSLYSPMRKLRTTFICRRSCCMRRPCATGPDLFSLGFAACLSIFAFCFFLGLLKGGPACSRARALFFSTFFPFHLATHKALLIDPDSEIAQSRQKKNRERHQTDVLLDGAHYSALHENFFLKKGNNG